MDKGRSTKRTASGPKMERSDSNEQKVQERDSIVSTMSESSIMEEKNQKKRKEPESATQG